MRMPRGLLRLDALIYVTHHALIYVTHHALIYVTHHGFSARNHQRRDQRTWSSMGIHRDRTASLTILPREWISCRDPTEPAESLQAVRLPPSLLKQPIKNNACHLNDTGPKGKPAATRLKKGAGTPAEPGEQDSPLACEYERCPKTSDVDKTMRIVDGAWVAGKQNWQRIAGKCLCNACYHSYKRKGTLERDKKARTKEGGGSSQSRAEVLDEPQAKRKKKAGTKEGGGSSQSRAAVLDEPEGEEPEGDPDVLGGGCEVFCEHKECPRTSSNGEFHVVKAESVAGGQDWTSLAQKTLCNACYNQYYRTGELPKAGVGDEGQFRA
jgi:hypothetical protein